MMMRKVLGTIAIACGAALTACDSSPTATDLRPEFDGRTRTTTATTTPTATTTTTTTTSGGSIGDPCDPETYTGPYRCIPDPDNDNGYIIAY